MIDSGGVLRLSGAGGHVKWVGIAPLEHHTAWIGARCLCRAGDGARDRSIGHLVHEVIGPGMSRLLHWRLRGWRKDRLRDGLSIDGGWRRWGRLGLGVGLRGGVGGRAVLHTVALHLDVGWGGTGTDGVVGGVVRGVVRGVGHRVVRRVRLRRGLRTKLRGALRVRGGQAGAFGLALRAARVEDLEGLGRHSTHLQSLHDTAPTNQTWQAPTRVHCLR